jgi:hypothetical protein
MHTVGVCGVVVDDEDSLEAAWFDVDTALTRVTHPHELQRLQDGVADLPEVVYRVYRGSS